MVAWPQNANDKYNGGYFCPLSKLIGIYVKENSAFIGQLMLIKEGVPDKNKKKTAKSQSFDPLESAKCLLSSLDGWVHLRRILG